MRTPQEPHATNRQPDPPSTGPSAMDTVRLRRLNRWQAEQLQEDLADLYVESSAGPPGKDFHRREEFLHRLAETVQQPGFDMLVAESTVLDGCVYGFPVGRDGSWWEGFDGQLPHKLEQLTASGHVFAITETLVHPHGHATGLAHRLHRHLLADHHASLGVTSVDTTDRTTLDAFLPWGWQEVGRMHRPPPGAGTSRVLVLALGERTAEHPDGLTHNDRTQRPA
ncbi:hypothetical protein GCM10010329_19110 [Streptomyces spiroverticillatus]|uniref:GNAT family N-acetyltransferase n=1 Tax=Streptomyces finlayi TaxID=67296 RepID=A0A919C7S8_9ACTN|nr:hypothetical protein [Streptomyces finlayi]GGZ97943.1 hypothetical protein GCM10010329_19110 [Streptomyces spiroverticillatus]GHC82926.1 hypothetical protein GCM10010334_11590 [Streptomyces finlayi]